MVSLIHGLCWNQPVWVTESQSPVGQKKEQTIVSFFLMIACFRFEIEFHFEYTSYYRKYLMVNSIITTAIFLESCQ